MILTLLEPLPPLGKDLATAVVAAFPDFARRLLHTQAEDEHVLLEVGGEPAVVTALRDFDELEGTSVLVVCGPPAPTRVAALVAWLRAHPEVVLLDASQPGIVPDETVCTVGLRTPDASARRWYCLPDQALTGPAQVLGALRPLEPDAVDLTVVLPVSPLGEHAITELAAQGAARLSGVTPDRPHTLARVLAFDVAPSAPPYADRLESQLAVVAPGLVTRVHALDAGVFFGNAAVLSLHCRARLDEKKVRALLRGHPGIHLPRRGENLAPSDVVDSDSIACSNLRIQGEWLSVWLVWDGSFLGGASIVVEALRDVIATAARLH